MGLDIKLFSIWCILFINYWQTINSLPQTIRINSNNYKNNRRTTIILEQYQNGKDYDGEPIAYNSVEIMKLQKSSNEDVPTFLQQAQGNQADLQQQPQVEQEYPSKQNIFANNSSLLSSLVLTLGLRMQQPEQSNLRKRQTSNDDTNNRTMMFNAREQPVKDNGKVDTEDADDDDLIITISSPKQFNGEQMTTSQIESMQQQQQQQQQQKYSQQIDNRIDLLKVTTTFRVATTSTTATSSRSTTVAATATSRNPDRTLFHIPLESGHLPLILPTTASSHKKLTNIETNTGAIALPKTDTNTPATIDIHVDINIHVDSNQHNNNSNKAIDIDIDENENENENENRPHQIELSNQYGNYDSTTTLPSSTASSTTATSTGIDMSDFLNLIPIEQVKAVMHYYYTSDLDVKCFYTKVAHPSYYDVTSYIVKLPEVDDFVIYLKQNDFDLPQFFNSLIKILTINTTIYNIKYNLIHGCLLIKIDPSGERYVNYLKKDKELVDAIKASVAKAKASDVNRMVNANKKAGMEGLVESLLDLLPQDQFLETFFTKMEEEPAFAHLIEEFGSETFQGHILAIQNSKYIQHLVANMNDNGIFFGKIFKQIKTWLSL